jgi:hypothetical protein
MPPVLHVVFTETGADDLREALKASGRDEPVVSFPDNLSFGPIGFADPRDRTTWIEEVLGFTGWPTTLESAGDRGWEDIAAGAETFWKASLARQHRKVAWFSRRSAMEYAGFLEWLWRSGDEVCEIVDLTEVKISSHPPHGPPQPPVLAISIAGISPNKIRDNKLWDLAEPLQIAAREGYLDLWRQLRTENAPLRVTDGNKLVSAPISFFDSLLLSYARTDWLKVARIVGEALVYQMEDHIWQASDVFLAARVNALVEAGRLELRGRSAFAMRFSEVRLPTAAP